MIMIIEFVILVVTVALLVDYAVKKRRKDLIKNIPGPDTLPLFGNALMYAGKNVESIMPFMFVNRKKYGPFYRVWIFNQLALFSSDPKDVEVILSSQKLITKNRLYDLLLPWLGTGLLMSTDKKWHSRRKIITPAFHFTILEQFVEVFDQQGNILIEKLKAKADGKSTFNIQPDICLAALDIIAETAMGTKVHAQTDTSCEYVRAVNETGSILALRFVNVWFRQDFIFRLFSPKLFKRLKDDIKLMHDFTENIIEERRKTLVEKQNATSSTSLDDKNDVDDVVVGSKRKMALLDVLLQSTIDGRPLTNEDIREEVDTFMFEGHDTTTSGLSFALHEISRHDDVQQKMYEEIVEKLGSNKQSPLTLRDLGELKYMECVIKEALRMYPPVPLIGRYFNEDVNMNGKIIPGGTNYMVGIFAMLKDPEYFPEPDSFKPERHFIENMNEKANPFSYVPFSAGPRNCIGQKFAMLEMKCTLTKIIRNFKLLPLGERVRPVLNLVLRSSNGMQLGLKLRE